MIQRINEKNLRARRLWFETTFKKRYLSEKHYRDLLKRYEKILTLILKANKELQDRPRPKNSVAKKTKS